MLYTLSYINSRVFPEAKHFWYTPNFQWVQKSIFPNVKFIFHNLFLSIYFLLKFKETEHLIHYVKLEM